jgi:NB-ARC domain
MLYGETLKRTSVGPAPSWSLVSNPRNFARRAKCEALFCSITLTPMPTKLLFLSCVSDEFKSYRETLRRDLDRPDVTVKVQEDFVAFGIETLSKLDAYIRQCEAVIHIVGDMTGATAAQSAVNVLLRTHPDIADRMPPLKALLADPFAGLSYTQWEAWLALYHDKPLLIACPMPNAPRDPDFVSQPAQRAAQRAHLARLAAVHRHPEITFENADRLAVDVLRSPLGGSTVVARARLCELPLRNPNFSGREEWLDTVCHTLGHDKPVVVAQAIVGLGGIGKTQLALEFAHRHADDYEIVWWIRAESVALRNEDLLALHKRMGLPDREGDTILDRLSTLRRALEATSHWLLVFDNVEETQILQDILPRLGGGHLLITSRLREWHAVALEVPLPVWSSVESRRYLAQRTGLPDDPDLQGIADFLGFLPLALEQAAAYMVQAGVGAAKYFSLLQRAGLEPLDVQGASAIATIWDVSIRAVRTRSQEALALLQLLAFMPPDNVSGAGLVGRSGISMPARLAGVLRDETTLNNAVSVLRSYSLVEASQDRIHIHRLVQLVVSHRLSAKDYRAYAEIARRLQPGWTLERLPPRSEQPRWPWTAVTLNSPSRRQAGIDIARTATAIVGSVIALRRSSVLTEDLRKGFTGAPTNLVRVISASQAADSDIPFPFEQFKNRCLLIRPKEI